MSDQEENMAEETASVKSSESAPVDETETESLAEYVEPAPSRPKILQTFKREYEPSTPPTQPQSVKKDKGGRQTDARRPPSAKRAAKETSHIQTQTDWSWIQDMQIMERIRREGADFLHDLLEEVNSDSGESDDESVDSHAKTNLDQTPRIDAVGPPKILQYQPEPGKKPEPSAMSESPALSVDSEPIEDLAEFMKELNVYINGGNTCEFCGKMTKKWPSIQAQEHSNPELLYCCTDYREFVEALIEYQNERDRAHDQQIASKTVAKPLNAKSTKRAQQLAKERAELRNIQRMLQRQKRMEQMAKERQTQSLSTATSRPSHEAGGTRDPSLKTREKMLEQLLESQQQQQQRKASKPSLESLQEMFDALDPANSAKNPFANQLRSINYQLSNLKYLQEGWTVRPKSPIDLDQINFNDLEYNLMAQAVVAGDAKLDDKSLIVRHYASGATFLVLFPDGSGSVFYPSGHVAISISTISAGMHILSVFSDDDESRAVQMASFDPYGNGFANYASGRLRVMLNPFGGVEMDAEGARRKRWFWSDLSEHVHAPPLQPIVFALNREIGVKIVNKDRISVNFVAETHMCRFMVGSKVKILNTEGLPPSIKFDPNETYLKKKRNRINDILRVLNEEHNVLRLPKIASTPRDFTTSLKSKPSLVTDVLKLNKSRETYNAKKPPRSKSDRFLTVP